MKKSLFVLSMVLMFATGFSQTLKTSVFSAGGGALQNTDYAGFGTFGQPFAARLSNGTYSIVEGFIFAQQNIITATITANETICYNAAASVLNSSYTGAEGEVTFQWQLWNGATWEDIAGATGETCNPGNLTGTTQYRLLVNDKSGIGQAISDTVTVTVYDAFTAGAIKTEGETICYGGDPSLIGNETLSTGGDENISYQWQSSTTGENSGFANITGAESSTYAPPAGLTDNTWYRRLAKDGTCSTTLTASTGVWKVTIQQKPVAYAGNDNTIVEDEEYQLADAAKSHETAIEWSTTGDGSFDAETGLNPTYTPGEDDIAAGTVELCLTASPTSPCALDSTDCMTLNIRRYPTIVIALPQQKDVLYTNPVTISGTAADADYDLSLVEVKLNDGNWQAATGTASWTINFDLVPGKNTIEARATDATSLVSDIEKVEVTLSIQVINIPQGWSYISSYLDPTDPNLINMFADIVGANNLIFFTGVNGMYAPPPFYINTLKTWDVMKGYKVKMGVQDELIIRGDSLTDNSVTFQAGVHFIPVLTNQTTDLGIVFDNPATDISYMLDIYSNLVYWPGGNIYTLSELIPGKGYMANFKNQVTLNYPPLSNFTVTDAVALPPAPGPWACNRTSNVHLISVSAEAINNLSSADYLGAFDSQGNCVGYAAIEKSGTNLLLTIFGDEQMTAENDGMMEGEMIQFRAYNSQENGEKEMMAIFNPTFPNTEGLFYINGLSGISGFKESATGVGENNLAAGVKVFPNPAKDVLNIVCSENLTVHETSGLLGFTGTLITAEGKLVKTFEIENNITKLDISDLQPGIYILKVESTENVVSKRVVIR